MKTYEGPSQCRCGTPVVWLVEDETEVELDRSGQPMDVEHECGSTAMVVE